VLRIGLLGIALVTLMATLGGCGGDATPELGSLRFARCNVAGVEDQLRGLEAGISATRRELDASDPRRVRQQILRSMEENAGFIHRQLRSLEQCTRNDLREAEGKPVHEATLPLPPARTVVGHRLGPPRVEPGEQSLDASPCEAYGKHGTIRIYLWPDTSHCARVKPGERLVFVNHTGSDSGHWDAVAIRVLVGDYELWIPPNGSGVIRAPVETYLGRGLHSVRVAGAPGETILMLPAQCAVRPPAKPGEELCFR
jgi:hypothetical protein